MNHALTVTLERALRMPALMAAGLKPDLKAKYKSLNDSENPPQIALVALMRKLIVMANASIDNDSLWVFDRLAHNGN